MDEHQLQFIADVFFQVRGVVTQGLAGLGPITGFALLPAPVRVILPPGISFYTFETISYTIDVYRGNSWYSVFV
jgi:alginate O-acetyltransferase complex protein AlgI